MMRYAKATAMFFIVFAVGFTIMSGIIGAIRAAHGEEATGPKWLTVVTIEMKNGKTLQIVYGLKGRGTTVFESKEACETNKKTDERLLKALTEVMAFAATQGDTVKSIECELDDSGEHV